MTTVSYRFFFSTTRPNQRVKRNNKRWTGLCREETVGLIGAETGDRDGIDGVGVGGGYRPGMIDARSGAADSHRCRRVPGVSPVPGVTRGLNTVTLRTENNGRDVETT